MKPILPAVVCLFGTIVFPRVSAAAADAEGCADLKAVPRVAGCLIQECSAKQHEPFDTGEESGGTLDANVNTLTYSCPASSDLDALKRNLDAAVHKAGFLNVAEDKADPANVVTTTRKGSRWLRWSASAEDGGTAYSITTASAATDKFKAEACVMPPALAFAKSCEIVECGSKSDDSAEMRTAAKDQTSIAGNVQTVMLSCPAASPAQMFPLAEDELKRSGFEIVFSDRDQPESGWLTGRAGKHWVELVSAPDGDAHSYTLTSIASADGLPASDARAAPPAQPDKPEKPAPVETASLQQASEPVVVAVQITKPSPTPAPVSTPVPAAAVRPPSAAIPSTGAEPASAVIPPRLIAETPIAASHDLMWSISGNVVIHMLVDVNEDGRITNAVLTGKITKDILRLEGVAREALSQWRFEPATQNGRAVSASKVPVQFHFQGRPWQY
jgi:hypothetical protein